ncbi:O-antigen ligase family protein [Patescibacteria group bacterium]|nr:O-antigen ligase family protein [Patescibacteria group bacterium]
MFNQLFGKYFKISFIVFIIIDVLSFFAYQDDCSHLIIFIVLTLLSLGLTLYKLELGLYIFLAELFIGSQGHLFSLATPYFGFSIRMSVFAIFFLVWLSKVIAGRRLDFFTKNNQFLYIYLLLFIAVAAGALRGILNNPLNQTFFDFNGWLFLAIVPAVFSIVRSFKVIKNILAILLSAVGFISLKTLVVLLLFAYKLPINLSIFYNWLRDSRIGEITHVTGTFYRIFFQAQIYVLIGFLLCFFLLLMRQKLDLDKVTVKWLRVIMLFSSTVLIACLSRSFWVGAVFALLFVFILLVWRHRFSLIKMVRLFVTMSLIVVVEIAFLFIITGNIPVSFTHNLIRDRLDDPTEEVAGMSRIAQLGPLWSAISQNWFWGSGFGKAVTYYTDDPRILAKSPTGIYNTYAFEWGYLDIWLKLGLSGLLIYLYLYYLVFKKGIYLIRKKADSSIFIIALLLGMAALLATNMFSPYLNHPLGIGYLILLSAIINFSIKEYVVKTS